MKNIMSENSFRSGKYYFNFDSEIFSVSEKQIILDRSEQRILRILTDNADIAVGSDVLICRIWENTDFVDENILAGKVSALAKKLSAGKRIVPCGEGYKWRSEV